MKTWSWIFAVALCTTLVLVGCSKSSGGVDAGPIEKSFAAAEPALKAAADKAVAAIKSADYSGALAELQKLGADVKLTEEQKKAITDTLAQLQKVIADLGAKAGNDASKALGDAQKALGK